MPTSLMPSPSDLAKRVHQKERLYFAMAAVFSVLVYAGIVLAAAQLAPARATIVTYAAIVVIVSLAMHGFMLGHVRGNGVRVSANQFPRLHAMVVQHARTFGMDVPEVFVLQAGGLLNAFATSFLGRHFVVLFSDVLAIAEERGEAAVSFIVGHELAHLKRGHLKWRWLLAPSRFVPFLSGAYSRACEYTCDAFGAAASPDGAVDGLLALAAGPRLYRQVDAGLYAGQVETEDGFWMSLNEIFASHPHLTKRVGELLRMGSRVPAYSPMRGEGVRAEA
ncbi:MAG TPA: M48 family metallopeptidase [Gemmatimonadaceae bacterium]